MYPIAVTATDRNVAFGTPVLSSIQISPLSVERNTPPPKVAAKMCPAPFIASVSHISIRQTVIDERPVLTVIGNTVNATSFERGCKDVSIRTSCQ